jgi:hypothetical protein
MTLGELMAYADEMEPLRAEWMLDAAQVAAYPTTMQFSPDAAGAWWDALATAARGGVAATVSAAKHVGGFMLNGVSTTFESLSAQLSRMLGGGVSE